jgi:hypothetical protein
MTIADLIRELQKYDPGMRVLVDGYEGGFDDPIVSTEYVLLNQPEMYSGKHQRAWVDEDKKRAVECVVLER